MQAFSWHWHYFIGQRDLMEQLLVFWLAPFFGALVAGMLYRLARGAPPSAPRSLPAGLKASLKVG
jgi:hypothetical protein